MSDMPTQMKIFVSHSSAHKAVSDQLVTALRGAWRRCVVRRTCAPHHVAQYRRESGIESGR